MLILLSCIFLIFIVSHLVYIRVFKTNKSKALKNCKTLIVIGSGGHTLEMVKHVKKLSPNLYCPRLYVMADTDTSSEYKIKELEREFQNAYEKNYSIVKIPRSRKVNQSYFSSLFTTFYSTINSIPIVWKFKPNLILCNGPGTCVPICLIAFLINAFFFYNIKIVYVESICRVKTLSLSGKILLHFADVVIVQWEKLQQLYPKTVFLGRFI